MTAEELATTVASREWYHTLELGPGVLTPGWFDTRRVAGRLPFPPLRGARCLDIGTFDGFWAFEMERREAAEVVAVDVLDPLAWDWPAGSSVAVLEELDRRKDAGRGFEIAKDALGSNVERIERSIYELDPDADGTFDFVYVGSLLLHLRDPVRALERARSVCRGRLLLLDAIHLPLTILHPRRAVAGFDGIGRPWWWKPNLCALERLVRSAGLEPVGAPQRVFMPRGRGQQAPPLRPASLASAAGRENLFARWAGSPHAALLARPAV